MSVTVNQAMTSVASSASIKTERLASADVRTLHTSKDTRSPFRQLVAQASSTLTEDRRPAQD